MSAQATAKDMPSPTCAGCSYILVVFQGIVEGGSPTHAALGAFDPLGFVAAANRRARADLLGRFGASGVNVEQIFDCTALDVIRKAHDRPGAPVALRYLPTGEQFYALLRAPTPARMGSAAASALRPPKEPREPGLDALPGFTGVFLGDVRIRQSAQHACKIANRRIPILLLGETGTGKESFAKAIHQFSDRRDKPFVALNCAAIPEGLIESELFGYTEGAFTVARAKGSKGKILQANGGTLFLDEIGDMPLLLQPRLLRVLAESEVLQRGSEKPVSIDLHVVCATNRDLRALVREGLFREDLYYRLNAATFELPPLRSRTDRKEVILAILHEESREQGRTLTLGPDALDTLVVYSWPGNLRELRNALRYACALCAERVVTQQHLPIDIVEGARTGPAVPVEPYRGASDRSAASGRNDDQERKRLVAALARNKWQVAVSARQLGVSRATLYRWMNRLHIVQPNRSA